jgi:MEMO1 family protein
VSRAGVLLPAVAGTWYPANASDLARYVDGLLDPPDAPAAAVRGRGLVVPHAGLAYSGGVAGLGFRTLSRDTRRVLLVGPTHYVAFRGAVVPRSTAYRTPLGDVPIDVDAVEQLARCDDVRRDDVPFGPEHSLEVELPFLQRHLQPGWCVLPVLVGAIGDAAVRESVVAALRPVRDAGTSTVVSSDFTHYGPRFGYVPFTERVAERIRELDHGAIECVVRSDADGFRQYIERTGATICGHAPIELWLEMLEPGTRGALVAYDTSGRITGDPGHSVSYASIVFP